MKEIIIIGLGNPGKRFENTPHSLGFLVLNNFAKKLSFPPFRKDKYSPCLISKKGNIVLLKPQSFMNQSGEAVKKFFTAYRSSPSKIIVVHDEADINLGQIKIVYKKSSAGHKGVESIIKNLGNNLIRLRIGIRAIKNTKKAEEIVLKKFSKEEKLIIQQTIKKAVESLDFLLKEGLERAMNEYNR